MTPYGITIFPMTEGRLMTPEEFQALEPKQAIDKVRAQLMQQTQDTMAKIRELGKALAQTVRESELTAGNQLVDQVFFELQALSQDIPEMREFLLALKEYVVSNIYLFKGSEGPKPMGGGMP